MMIATNEFFSFDFERFKNEFRAASLEDKHLAMVRENAPWNSMWEMFVEDREFLEIQRMAVDRCVRRTFLPTEWTEDLRQQSTLHFAFELKKKPDLGFDSEKGSFKGWIYTIVFGSVQKATRQFKDSFRQQSDPEMEKHQTGSEINWVDLGLDTNHLISSFDDVRKVVFLRYAKGIPVSVIAQELNLSDRKTYRILKQAIDAIRNLAK